MTRHPRPRTIERNRRLGTAIRRRKRLLAILTLLAMLSAAGAATTAYSLAHPAGRQQAVAVAAREVTLRETGHLHLVSHHKEQIVETGSGTGTLSGTITVNLTLAFSQATVGFTAHPSTGGTVVGHGEGKLYAGGHVANFTGTATITGGTGQYAHASGRNIRLEGTLQRKTFALSVKVEGKMRY
jgi:hypothetical protein